MKYLKFAILLAIAFISVTLAVNRQPAQAADKETVVVQFYDRISIGKTILPAGWYVFEHDDGRMAKGEPCMNVFSALDGKADKLMVAFHCTPIERPFAAVTKTNEVMTEEAGVFRLLEIQFAGTKKGHLVP